MMKTCSVCQHTGEPTWRDGTYYCPMCGTVIDMTTPSPAQPTPPAQPTATAPAGVAVAATCPICRNDAGNMLINGRCRCALCGSMFDYAPPTYQQTYYQDSATAYSAGYPSRRQMLVKRRNSYRNWGIFWIFFFWPASLYMFYKMMKISDEIQQSDFDNRYR